MFSRSSGNLAWGISLGGICWLASRLQLRMRMLADVRRRPDPSGIPCWDLSHGRKIAAASNILHRLIYTIPPVFQAHGCEEKGSNNDRPCCRLRMANKLAPLLHRIRAVWIRSTPKTHPAPSTLRFTSWYRSCCSNIHLPDA